MPGKLRCIDIQQFAIGAITDALDRHLIIVLHGEARRRFDFLNRYDVQAVTTGQIGVGFEQPSAVGAQGAIEHFLADRAHRQEVVAVADHPVIRKPALHVCCCFFESHVEPNRERSLVCHFPQEIDFGKRRPEVLERGDAMPQGLFASQPHHAAHFLFGHASRSPALVTRVSLAEYVLRRLAHHPGRAAIGITDDFATLGRDRVVAEFDQCHRFLIHEYAVPTRVNQHCRVIRCDCAQ